MKHAETVTFGGSGLNRVAELRCDTEEQTRRIAAGRAQTLLLWRGKLLAQVPDLQSLIRLPVPHPILEEASGPPMLLGEEEDGMLTYAHDISGWVPEGLDAAQLGQFLDTSEQQHPGLPQTTAFAELRRMMTRLSPRDAELGATAKALSGWHLSHRFCARCGQESRMIASGWQRSCTSCGAQHFPRTDPVVIMLITRGNRALLGRSPGWPEGMYSCLAGFVEPGETIEAAVRREVFEEAGIRVGHVDYVASQPWAFPSSLMFGCRGEALDEAITIDPSEIEDAIWVSKDDVMLAFSGQNPALLPARKGAIAHFLLRNWLADTLD